MPNLFRSQRLRISSAWILYAVLDDVCDEYIPVVETLEREGDVIDVQVLMKDANDQPHMIE